MALLRSTQNALQDIQIIQEGVGEPITVLATMDNAIKRVCKTGSREVADEIVRVARQKVPKRSRALHDTIATFKRASGEWGVTAGGVAPDGTDVDYAIYVEYGTYKMAARPFLRPAIAETTGYAKAQYAQAVWWDKQFAAARAQEYMIPLSEISSLVGGRFNPTPAMAHYATPMTGGKFMGNIESPGSFTGKFSGKVIPAWK